MNRLIILALIVCSSMMATACKGSKSEASNAVSEQPQQAVNLAEVPFLKAMGLDVSKVAIGTEYDTKIFATDAGQGKEVRLTDKQVKQLLGGAPLIDLGEGGAPFVVGAKAFADNVMLVFWHEVGDGHELILATYNAEKGDLRDISTTPSWEFTQEWDGENIEGQIQTYDHCRATFSAGGFVLHRKNGRNLGGKSVWSQERDYNFAIIFGFIPLVVPRKGFSPHIPAPDFLFSSIHPKPTKPTIPPQKKEHSLLVLPSVHAIINFATEFFEMFTKKQS